MSHMNLQFGVITYEDSSITNPTVRSLDVSRSLLGIPVVCERTDKVENLSPGESRVIASTLRAISQDNTTVYSIYQPWSSDTGTTRLAWTGVGTPPGFGTYRNLGLTAVSVVSINRLNPATCRISSVSMDTTQVQVGDVLKFEKSTDLFTSVFSVSNQAAFKVLSKDIGSIDVTDNGIMNEDQNVVLGPSFGFQLRVFSNGTIKVGDILELSNTPLNPNNLGKFQILDFSYDYVQFTNLFAVSSVFTNTNTVQIYDRLMGFVFIRASDTVSLKVNDGNSIKIQRLGSNEAIFLGSVVGSKLELVNEEQSPVSATVHYSSLV